MKFKKILMLLLIAITVISLFTINSSAADEVDYNKSFAINIDGEYTYYKIDFLNNASTWEDYLRFYKEQNLSCEFDIVGNYIVYNDNVLLWQNNYVLKTDVIRPSAGAGIYYLDTQPLFLVDDNRLTLHPIFAKSLLDYWYLIQNYDEFYFQVLSKYGSSCVTYNGLLVCEYDFYGHPYYFDVHDQIMSNSELYLTEYICNHFYASIMRIEATCIKSGVIYYECILCHNDSYVETIGIDKDAHMNQNTIYKAPTCNTSGYYKLTCKDCHKVITYNYDPKGHTFTTPTMCYERPKCLDCGFETSEGMLVHDAGDGCDCIRCGLHIKLHEYDDSGTCTRCGYTLPPVETPSAGEVVVDYITDALDWAGNGIKNTWNWITSGVSKGASAVGEGAKDVVENFFNDVKDLFLGDDGILTGAVEVLKIVFMVMAIALLVFVVIKVVILYKTKVLPQLKTRKTRKRRKRRK